MSLQKFPRTDARGHFQVKAGLRLEARLGEECSARIKEWLDDRWVRENRVWHRKWKTGPNLSILNTEALEFEDSFLRSPDVIFEPPATLCILLHGRDRSSPWRDWLISKIIPDVRRAFPQVGDPLFIKDSG